MKSYQWYCPKCGLISFLLTTDSEICTCCHYQMIETPHEYNLTEKKMQENYDAFEQSQKLLFDEIIITSSEFDMNLYNNRDSILKQHEKQQEEAIAHGKAILEGKDKGNKFGIECPYCHATNVEKITNISKAVHTAIFGIFSMGRNGKQWHCNHCNSDF